jgi:phosphoribosylaminoimidazolecarboxamide formyltransferase/IMP cyclohydrolase
MSYNNWLDLESAWKCASEIQKAYPGQKTCVVVKHLNPCGVGTAADLLQALDLAWEGDPVSAFGGILAFSGEVDEKVASWFEKKFIEILYAPSFTVAAKEIFAKKKNLRLVEGPLWKVSQDWLTKSLSGVDLCQREEVELSANPQTVTTKKFPESTQTLQGLARFVSSILKVMPSH